MFSHANHQGLNAPGRNAYIQLIFFSPRVTEYSQWWCSMINGCCIVLGASPVDLCPLPEEDSLTLESQIEIGPLHLFQGRLHSHVTRKKQQMGADNDKRILTLHLMWKMAATVWRSRNQALHGTSKAEREYAKKTHLDRNISIILELLRENQIPYRSVPLGYSFTIDSKQAWLWWETMSLKAHQISIPNSHHTGDSTHATSTENLGRNSQHTCSRKRHSDQVDDPVPSQ